MFTGLIEEVGTIENITQLGGGKKIKIKANKVIEDVKIDDSIAVDGCCQTVIQFDKNNFEVVAIEETLRKTTLGSFKIGQKVNLERALRVGDRLGGHYVQGHVDCVGSIKKVLKEKTDWLVSIQFPVEFKKYVVNVGSICLNGISLTVAKVENNVLTVAIIPHTFENTNLKNWKVGSKINLEFDILGKYVESILNNK